MKKISKANAASRAITGLLSVALVTSGMTAVAAPAFAEQTAECANVAAKPAKGLEGTYSIKDADSKNFTPGATITITGKGVPPRNGGFMVFKLDYAKNPDLSWDEDAQSSASGLTTIAENKALKLPAEDFSDGSFSVDVVLPNNLADGKHVLSLLVGNDGMEPRGGQHVEFMIDSAQKNDGHCGTHAGTSVTKVTGYPVDHRKGNLAGEVVLEGTALNLDASTPVTFSVDGTQLSPDPQLSTDEAGKVKFKLTLSPGTALAGTHTLTISDGTNTEEATFATDVYATINHAGAQGSSATANVANLPAGAQVTAVGIAGTNWWTGSQAAAADGSAEVTGVAIPADAPFGASIVVTYTDAAGVAKTVDTGVKVSATDAPEAVNDYDVKQVDLGPGLYQTAINNETNELFVTRSNRTKNAAGEWEWDATLYKLDATTLEVKQQVDFKPTADAPIHPMFGIGLDNKNGLIWVSSSKVHTIAAYKQEDLSLVKQWPDNFIGHPRDIVVDQQTGKAWISSVFNKTAAGDFTRANGNVWVVDYKAKESHAIDLGTFPFPMSLELDPETHYLYTVSRNSPQIARINVETEKVDIWDMPADKVDGASGVTLDTKHKKLYVAAAFSGNTLVFDANDGKFLKEIRTGAGALSARYNPVDGRVYVAHRDASTVVAIDTETDEIVARFDNGVWFNHINVGADGTVYAVDKASMNPASGVKKDHLFAFKLKDVKKPGSSIGQTGSSDGQNGASNDQNGSSDDNGELPTWATALISIASILGILGILAGLAPHIAKHFGIRLPF